MQESYPEASLIVKLAPSFICGRSHGTELAGLLDQRAIPSNASVNDPVKTSASRGTGLGSTSQRPSHGWECHAHRRGPLGVHEGGCAALHLRPPHCPLHISLCRDYLEPKAFQLPDDTNISAVRQRGQDKMLSETLTHTHTHTLRV